MNGSRPLYRSFASALALLALALAPVAPAAADSLYIGDGGDNSVKRFDAVTGAFQGTFVAPGNGLLGPRGIVFTKGRLFLVNQNVNAPFNGEVLAYRPGNGTLLNVPVACNPPLRTCNVNSPFFPRGMIRGPGYMLYVADWKNTPTSGRIAQYDLRNGAFIGNLDTTGFTGGFFPRAIVRGPDDLLYVSVTGDPDNIGDTTTGMILRFSAQTGKFVDVFTSNTHAGCATFLNHPEGLSFGPNGALYVVNLPNLDIVPPTETGRILVFNRVNHACVQLIDLGVAGGSPGFAASIVFAPNNHLLIPNIQTGEVRSFDPVTKTFSVFIPAGTLLQPWYMSFGLGDPESLEYLN